MPEEITEVPGRVHKDLKIGFKSAYAGLEVTQTAVWEEAIRDWLQKEDSSAEGK
ncbi:hypothetical protein [Nostoc sp. JL33]|uniref:hypothetical protein n=1 Tax=Nostoc sp. JL33 TaxID=2815396 RepID=UPI0025EEF905|nr:hypothetical protein [Nostoc sp. JL33]MBN3873871.1 hypothetical protein [Nostoc sp. JL33]